MHYIIALALHSCTLLIISCIDEADLPCIFYEILPKVAMMSNVLIEDTIMNHNTGNPRGKLTGTEGKLTAAEIFYLEKFNVGSTTR